MEEDVYNKVDASEDEPNDECDTEDVMDENGYTLEKAIESTRGSPTLWCSK